MVDVEAYRLLHEAKGQAQPERGEIVAVSPDKPGFENFLRQLPSTIYGFRMDDKAWGMITTQSSRILESLC